MARQGKNTRASDECAEEDGGEPVTRSERIATVSAALGFSPKRQLDSFVLEYAKTYALPDSHRAVRATAQFDKGVAGIGHAELTGFVVTVMAYIPPVAETVKKLAPEIVKADLLAYLDNLGNMPREPASLTKVACDECAAPTAEFVSKEDKRLCMNCFQRKYGGIPKPPKTKSD